MTIQTLSALPLLAAQDKTFLEQVGEKFASPPPVSEEALIIVVIILTVLAIVIVGAVVLNQLRFGRRRKQARAGWITEPKTIATLLQRAMADRAKFEVAFRVGENLFVPCALLDVSHKGLTLDLGAGRVLDAHWKGRTVRAYFRTDLDGGPVFLAFESPIIGIAKREGAPLCLLATPTAMERTQKRMHLRVEPPEEMILGIAVWQAPPSPLPDEYNVDGLGPAQLTLHPGRGRAVIRVENISAGGLRLVVERVAARLAELRCGVGNELVVRLDLYLPEAGGRLRLWLHVRVQSGFDDAALAEIGCLILHQGVVRDAENDTHIHWRPVTEDGVAVLGNWAIQRDLEQHRMVQDEDK